MAEQGGWAPTFTLVSEFDNTARQYRVVIASPNVDLNFVVASQAGDGPIIGVLQSKPASGEGGTIAVGNVKVSAGAAVTRGDVLRANATGFVVTGNSGYTAGVALETTTSGSVFRAMIIPGLQSIA